MSLTEKERNSVVKFRLDKAKEALMDFYLLIDNERYNCAANRLYYACFYAVSALLINDNYTAHTHKGVKTLLGLHYIKENKIEESYSKIYERLFNMRQKGDYEDCFIVKEEDILPLIEPAQKFITEIESLIYNKS